MPIQSEVASRNGKVGGDCNLFFRAKAKQGAVVADAQAQSISGIFDRPAADLADERQFSAAAALVRCCGFVSHLMRIGQRADERSNCTVLGANFILIRLKIANDFSAGFR